MGGWEWDSHCCRGIGTAAEHVHVVQERMVLLRNTHHGWHPAQHRVVLRVGGGGSQGTPPPQISGKPRDLQMSYPQVGGGG